MIHLSEPSIQGNEWKYIKECLDSGWVSSAGKYVDLFEKNIAEYTGAKYAIACINGTSALQVSLRLAGVEPGDEVIVPTITFISPINAIRYNCAEPVFIDADKYYNIDTEKAIDFIKKKTVFRDGSTINKDTNRKIKAIIPVHVFGNAVWLDELVPLCEERNIVIIEDAAESLGTRYTEGIHAGQHTGTIGLLGCLSFNGNKIITTGGGGMILTDKKELANNARYLTTQAKDDPIRYIHYEIGYNFRLSNIQAALGVAQLEQLSKFLRKKYEIFNQYECAFESIEGISLAGVPGYADNNHWMNVLQIDNKTYVKDKEELIEYLKKNDIETRPIWQLNHLQKKYRNCENSIMEKSLDLWAKSLNIPSSINITKNQIDYVIKYLSNE